MAEEGQTIETQPSTPPESDVVRRIRTQVPDAVLAVSDAFGEETIVVQKDRIGEVMACLRDDPALLFNYLVDITAVDRLYLDDPVRFTVVYHLYSYTYNRRLRVKAPVPEEAPNIASVVALWPSADWTEREVYDMYGIVFEGHPDLRRLLMPDDFGSYPLRKDYPLHGKGERDNFVF
jgi:NADH-quinone oxidoreductase subunit C